MLDSEYISQRMYEAAFLPEMWTPLLDELAISTKSGVGGIGVYWPVQKGISTTFDISPGRDQWDQTSDSTKRWMAFVRSKSYVNAGFFQIDPIRGDWSELPDFENRIEFHKERGYGVQAATIVELFNGEIVSLEFTRRAGEPRYEKETINFLRLIYPAFRQAVFFSSRLQFERARGSLDTLNDMELPAALLDSNGHVLLSNALFESADRYFNKSASGKISINGSESLRKSFSHALEISELQSVNMPIPAQEYRDPAVVHLMPMCRDAKSIFSMFCKIMVVAPVSTRVGVPSSEMVSDLFGLTPKEAYLATTIASGLSLRDSAANQGITIGTARSYLVRIFSKTGTNQQSELVSLLKSVF